MCIIGKLTDKQAKWLTAYEGNGGDAIAAASAAGYANAKVAAERNMKLVKAHAKKQRKDKQLEIAHRRVEVERMYIRGKTYRDIAEALGVSIGTIAGDMKAILEGWRDQSIAEIADFKLAQMERLQKLLAANWHEAVTGDVKVLAQVRGILQDMNKLMGVEDVRVDGQLTITWADPLADDDDIGIGAEELPDGDD